MSVFKKEWKEHCVKNMFFEDTHRMQYCVSYQDKEGFVFWEGDYVCYGKSKIGGLRGPTSKLNFMGLFGKDKNVFSHHNVPQSDYPLARRLVRKIKKSEKLSFIYDIINTTVIKIRDNLYLFKVDITYPKWQVQVALFAHRAFDNMSSDEMKWAYKLNDHDLLKFLLLAYCRTNKRNTRTHIPGNYLKWGIDANVLGEKPDSAFELLWKMLDGERSPRSDSISRSIDNSYSSDGSWQMSYYLKLWIKELNPNKRYTVDKTVHIADKTFRLEDF